MEKLCRSLGFPKFEIIEARGLVGGLMLMWKADVDLIIV